MGFPCMALNCLHWNRKINKNVKQNQIDRYHGTHIQYFNLGINDTTVGAGAAGAAVALAIAIVCICLLSEFIWKKIDGKNEKKKWSGFLNSVFTDCAPN